MTEIAERQVLKWRVATSFAWSVILLPLSCVAFIAVSRLNILHPIQWLTDLLGDATSSSTFFCLLLLSVLQGVQCAFNVKSYSVVPTIPGSRLSLIGQILLPQRVIHSFVHSLMGVLVFWCCTVLSRGPYHSLAVPCNAHPSDKGEVPKMCLNERYLFLLLTGAFLGYTYSLLYFIHNMNYLSFPVMQQFKYLQFRRFLPLLLHYSCVQSLYMVRNFTAVYFFLGSIPRAWFQGILNLYLDQQLPPLDSLLGLLDFSLFYQIWLCGTFLLVTWHIVWLLFQIHTTETRMFPIQTSFVEDAEMCLPNALSCNSSLLKYLAFQDLVLLSQYSKTQRQEVFSLSQPGGHPYNWTAICTECLSVLSNLTDRLVAHQEAAASNGRVRFPSSAELRKSSSSSGTSLNESVDQAGKISPVSRTPISSLIKIKTALKRPWDSGGAFASPVLGHISTVQDQNSPWHGSVQSPHIIRRGTKLWTCGTDVDIQRSASEASSISQVSHRPVSSSEGPSFFFIWYQNRLEQIKNFLSKRVLIIYLFSKHPEASSQEVFADSQIHIWALEGLSHLVAASFSEDRMGVVQTTLSNILATLLNLQEAVEKHFKLPHVSSKPARAASGLADSSYKTLRFALRSTLKTAIYRITTTFGEHLHAIPVSTEHRKKLQQFLDFKE
ncbi:PREDICTED: nucleoporin NDC1 [Nanorana parkeri]|uniref:nucleoporin NDC1 n=1 Tax=Nanorana parkeri TaxID=125878 RepID=UPI00085502BF|nr:PREDICTED: nucleoporin NDC1 [Nanorana parkeri]